MCFSSLPLPCEWEEHLSVFGNANPQSLDLETPLGMFLAFTERTVEVQCFIFLILAGKVSKILHVEK